MNAQDFVTRLEKVTGKYPRWRAKCPSCGGKNGSKLSIREAEDDGRLLVKCFAGCSIEQVTKSMGLNLSDLMPGKAIADRLPRMRPPAREVVSSLQRELSIAWVILTDLARGKEISGKDRYRAGQAAKSCTSLIHQLTA